MSLASVPPHGHCEICKTPITEGDRFCPSAACKEQHEKDVKERKKQVYLMVGLIAAALVLSKFLGGF